jgi:hypothetical protein
MIGVGMIRTFDMVGAVSVSTSEVYANRERQNVYEGAKNQEERFFEVHSKPPGSVCPDLFDAELQDVILDGAP